MISTLSESIERKKNKNTSVAISYLIGDTTKLKLDMIEMVKIK